MIRCRSCCYWPWEGFLEYRIHSIFSVFDFRNMYFYFTCFSKLRNVHMKVYSFTPYKELTDEVPIIIIRVKFINLYPKFSIIIIYQGPYGVNYTIVYHYAKAINKIRIMVPGTRRTKAARWGYWFIQCEIALPCLFGKIPK